MEKVFTHTPHIKKEKEGVREELNEVKGTLCKKAKEAGISLLDESPPTGSNDTKVIK